jgi:type VI protein secretion system component VasF
MRRARLMTGLPLWVILLILVVLIIYIVMEYQQ